MVLDSRASLSVSELRIPLMWRDVDHFKQRGDYKRYAIFCLLKINSQIYDTQLISDVDWHKTDITFDDLVIFNEVDYNFELSLEVYSCIYLEEFSFSSTPRKLKEKLTSSVSKAMGKRLLTTQTASTNYTKELQSYEKSYRFSMIANAVLKLEDASQSVKTYDLVLTSPQRSHQQANENQLTANHYHSKTEFDKNTLPLFGHFCCKLLVVPDVFDKNTKSGLLKVRTIQLPPIEGDRESDLSQQSDSHRASTLLSSKMSTMSMSNATIHYALLRNFKLHLWPIDEPRLEQALSRNQPLPQFDNLHKSNAPLILNINKHTRLLRVSNSSLTLETNKTCSIILSAYCSNSDQSNQADEMGHWLRSIEQSIYDSHIWAPVLDHHLPPNNAISNSSDTIGRGQSHKNNYGASRLYSADSSYSGAPYSSTPRKGSSSITHSQQQRQGRENHYNRTGASLQADL